MFAPDMKGDWSSPFDSKREKAEVIASIIERAKSLAKGTGDSSNGVFYAHLVCPDSDISGDVKETYYYRIVYNPNDPNYKQRVAIRGIRETDTNGIIARQMLQELGLPDRSDVEPDQIVGTYNYLKLRNIPYRSWKKLEQRLFVGRSIRQDQYDSVWQSTRKK